MKIFNLGNAGAVVHHNGKKVKLTVAQVSEAGDDMEGYLTKKDVKKTTKKATAKKAEPKGEGSTKDSK